MQVDFYQLSRDPAERVIPQIARRVLDSGERLLVVEPDAEKRALLSQALWSVIPDSFLAHGDAAEPDAETQPILLSDRPEATNGARFVLLADGVWRDAALKFDRAFHFFDGAVIEGARAAWRTLSKQEGVEPRYWRQEGGKWVQAA